MYKMIAVEDGLTNISQALQSAGFRTTPLEGVALHNIQAAIVKGDGTSILAPEWAIKVPVVNAAGRSADEVIDLLRDRLS
jgi:hypothetical protein